MADIYDMGKKDEEKDNKSTSQDSVKTINVDEHEDSLLDNKGAFNNAENNEEMPTIFGVNDKKTGTDLNNDLTKTTSTKEFLAKIKEEEIRKQKERTELKPIEKNSNSEKNNKNEKLKDTAATKQIEELKKIEIAKSKQKKEEKKINNVNTKSVQVQVKTSTNVTKGTATGTSSKEKEGSKTDKADDYTAVGQGDVAFAQDSANRDQAGTIGDVKRTSNTEMQERIKMDKAAGAAGILSALGHALSMKGDGEAKVDTNTQGNTIDVDAAVRKVASGKEKLQDAGLNKGEKISVTREEGVNTSLVREGEDASLVREGNDISLIREGQDASLINDRNGVSKEKSAYPYDWEEHFLSKHSVFDPKTGKRREHFKTPKAITHNSTRELAGVTTIASVGSRADGIRIDGIKTGRSVIQKVQPKVNHTGGTNVGYRVPGEEYDDDDDDGIDEEGMVDEGFNQVGQSGRQNNGEDDNDNSLLDYNDNNTSSAASFIKDKLGDKLKDSFKKGARKKGKDLAKEAAKKKLGMLAKQVAAALKAKIGAALAWLFGTPPGWITLGVIFVIVVIIVAAMLLLPQRAAREAESYKDDKIILEESEFAEDRFLRDKYIIKELIPLQKYEEEVTSRIQENMADKHVFYEDKKKKENDANTEDSQVNEEIEEDEEVIKKKVAKESEKTKVFKDYMADAFTGDGIIAASQDIIPFLLKVERQSYAWSYPNDNIIMNDTERKVYKLYSNLRKTHSAKVPSYVTKDVSGSEVSRIYEFADFSREQIFEEYKKVFYTREISVLTNGTYYNITDPLTKTEPLNKEEKLDLLKKQMDFVYKRLIESYKKTLAIVQYCNDKYINDSSLSNKFDEAALIYKIDENDQKIEEIYLTSSMIHKFRKIREDIDLTYEILDYQYDYSPNMDLFYDQKDEFDMVDNAKPEPMVQRTYKSAILDFQEFERSYRTSWYYINAFLQEKYVLESQKKWMKKNKEDTEEYIKYIEGLYEKKENELTNEEKKDKVEYEKGLEKQLDKYNILANIVSASTPYFKYIYPMSENPMKYDDILEGIVGAYGEQYKNFDLLQNPYFKPFFDWEMNDKGQYVFDNIDFEHGYIEVDQDKLADKLKEMKEKSTLMDWFKRFWTFTKEKKLLSMKKEYLPATERLYNPHNHEIVEKDEERDITPDKLYVKKKIHKNVDNYDTYFDSYNDNYDITRHREAIYVEPCDSGPSPYEESIVRVRGLDKKKEPGQYTEANKLIINRKVVRELPSIKPIVMSNIFSKNEYIYEPDIEERVENEPSNLDKSKSYIEEVWRTPYTETCIEDDEGNETCTREYGEPYLYEKIHHIIYEKTWNVFNGSATIKDVTFGENESNIDDYYSDYKEDGSATTDIPSDISTGAARTNGRQGIYQGIVFEWPADTSSISSAYGNRILNGKTEFHKGMDIDTDTGDKIYAAADGTVTISGWVNGYGNYIMIEHGKGILTGYGHNSKLLVKKGDKVARGQTIAITGNTGESYGIHLHFEVKDNGNFINPMKVFQSDPLKLDTSKLDSDWKQRIQNASKYDSYIKKVGAEMNVDPQVIKIFIAWESSGILNTTYENKDENGKVKSIDYGLMQVNSGWGSQFDYQRMLRDAEYAIRCGTEVIVEKIKTAKNKPGGATVFNVYWMYNGDSEQGKQNATKIAEKYKLLTGKDPYKTKVTIN